MYGVTVVEVISINCSTKIIIKVEVVNLSI
nr:MAG TPA: hypothetical protein [Caudoviricetes sp.]